MNAPHHDGYAASIVIPAYNEETLLQGTLDALAAQTGMRHMQVIVVPNGCRDNTAKVAREFTGIDDYHVIERERGSKIEALNAGDAVATHFPRIYLDADIVLPPHAVSALCEALSTPGTLNANLTPRIVTDHSSWPVKAFWEVFSHLPYGQDGASCGVYAMSEEGRGRFDQFPDVIADDLFIHERFAPSERVMLDTTSTVLAPRTLEDLIATRTRVVRGNAQLAEHQLRVGDSDATTTADTVKALAQLVLRKPTLAPHAAIYAAVAIAARKRARSTAQGTAWERDSSTR